MKKQTVPSVAVVFHPEGASYQQMLQQTLIATVRTNLEGEYESKSRSVSSPVKG
jgi:hypothetical protein